MGGLMGADLRRSVVYRAPAQWPRGHESIPPLVLALLVFSRTRSLAAVAPAYGYVAYLLLDRFLIPQRRLVKRIRNVSPIAFLMAYAPVVLGTLGLPAVPAPAALVAVMAGALLPFLYERGRTVLDFVRGVVLAAALELGALYLAPTGIGPHVALPLFAAAYSWQKRTAFSSCAAPLLAVYALGGAWLLGGRFAIVIHAAAALVAWLGVSLFPYRVRAQAQEEEPQTGLHLRD